MVKDVTHYPLPRHGLDGWNSISKMFRWFQSSFPSLHEDFYGMILHDTTWNYLSDGISFSTSGNCDNGPSIEILYSTSNKKLDATLLDYLANRYGERVQSEYGDDISSKSRELRLSRAPKMPHQKIALVELIPFCTGGRDMIPEEAADRLSDLISYLFDHLRHYP